MTGSFGHSGDDLPHKQGGPRGPYGTNLGDIWSAEDSPVGQRLLKEENGVLIHEVIEKDGQIQEGIYWVALDNPDMQMQDLIKRAREGTVKWVKAVAATN